MSPRLLAQDTRRMKLARNETREGITDLGRSQSWALGRQQVETHQKSTGLVRLKSRPWTLGWDDTQKCKSGCEW